MGSVIPNATGFSLAIEKTEKEEELLERDKIEDNGENRCNVPLHVTGGKP